jgi:hypothetical protein
VHGFTRLVLQAVTLLQGRKAEGFLNRPKRAVGCYRAFFHRC